MSDEAPSPEELKKMIEKAKTEAEKKRQAQAAKVGQLKTSDTEKQEIEKVLEKKLGQG
ncbi:MAG: hypothetical protein ACTSYB_00800 [Candidatus Helarchaeota archaeon]